MPNRDKMHVRGSAPHSQSSFAQPLGNIYGSGTSCKLLRSGYEIQPPETPQEPMEFLSRSWSISAMHVAKTIDARRKSVLDYQSGNQRIHTDDPTVPATVPFTFASTMTAQTVMDRILAHKMDLTIFSRRKLFNSGSMHFTGSCPDSPSNQGDDLMFCRSFSAVRNPLRDLSMKRWIKDAKERKKEVNRAHSARVHAALSVAGVAAAVAAMAATSATSEMNNEQSKTSMAVASAAALVAAQCVEVAESMGASCDQLSSVVSSAVRVKTSGDIMTLTAAAATALRGAATLNARLLREMPSLATLLPHENFRETSANLAPETVSEESEIYCCSLDCLSKGCEFLKRTRNGNFHWRIIYAYLDGDHRVVVKSRGRYMGGAITKNKKRFVIDVYNQIPSWPERGIFSNGKKRWCFGIKTDTGLMELECKSETDYHLWTEGILRLLSLSENRMQS